MSLEIHSVSTSGFSPELGKSDGARNTGIQQRISLPAITAHEERKEPHPDEVLRELLDFPDSLQRKLKFSVKKELDLVVVKVIDAETDKLIKEIPPQELQSLHVHIREALGLLIDEKV